MQRALGVTVLFLVVLLVGSPAWGGEAVLLNDEELDQVYAGQNENELTNSDNNVVPQNSFTCSNGCNPNFSGQSANSAIIVNAFGSIVNAQLNLTVYNGSYGTVNQMDVGFTATGGGSITN